MMFKKKPDQTIYGNFAGLQFWWKRSKTKVNKQGFEPDYKSSALSIELPWLFTKENFFIFFLDFDTTSMLSPDTNRICNSGLTEIHT